MDNLGETNTGDSLYPSKPRENPELGQQQLGQNPAEANRAELLEVFWRGRWIIITAVIVAIGAAILYLQSTTPLYASSSSIYVSQNLKTISNDGTAAQAPQDAYYLATQVEVIKSSSILNIASDRLRTRNVRFFSSSDSPVTLLKLGLSVELGKLNDIITISFESPSPEDSAEAVNAIVDAYQTYMADQRKSTAGEMLKILEGEFREREQERNDKMQKLVDFRNENSDVNLNEQGVIQENDGLATLSGINAALTAAQLEEAESHARYDLAKSYIADPLKLRQLMLAEQQPGGTVQSGETPEEQQLRGYWNALQFQLADLRVRLGTEHPDVIRVERQIVRVEAQLNEMGATPSPATGDNGMTRSEKQVADAYVGGALERWKLAQAKVQALNDSFAKSYNAQRDKAIGSNNKVATYQLLKEDFTRTDELCNQIDTRTKELSLNDKTGPTNVSILEVGKPSMIPSKPQHAKTIGIALMLGLGLGMGLAFLNGWMDQRFRSAEDVSNSLQLCVLGALPQISGREAINVRGQKAHLMPVSDYAEACRAIRTAIYFGMPDSQAKTLLVTSPLPGDGKSTVVSNLAIVMAQAGQKTLVLDADYRRPNQHRIFEQANTLGSTNVLAGTATLDEAIKPTGIKGVDLLPCGPTPSHPAELLNSQAFADLLQELSKRYDHVVVDSPPVMPVTDARILGAVCDATVFVVRAEKSTRKVSLFARDVLQSVGTNILGVAINGLSRTRGYYDAGYYQYGYGGKGSATRKGNAVPVEGASEPILTPEPGSDETAVAPEDSNTI